MDSYVNKKLTLTIKQMFGLKNILSLMIFSFLACLAGWAITILVLHIFGDYLFTHCIVLNFWTFREVIILSFSLGIIVQIIIQIWKFGKLAGLFPVIAFLIFIVLYTGSTDVKNIPNPFYFFLGGNLGIWILLLLERATFTKIIFKTPDSIKEIMNANKSVFYLILLVLFSSIVFGIVQGSIHSISDVSYTFTDPLGFNPILYVFSQMMGHDHCDPSLKCSNAGNALNFSVNPTFLSLYYLNRAECLVWTNRYDDALQEYDKMLQFSSNYPFHKLAFIGKGNVYFLLNKDAEAKLNYFAAGGSDLGFIGSLADQNLFILNSKYYKQQLDISDPELVKQVLFGYENISALEPDGSVIWYTHQKHQN
jgi:hypothetical protein